MTPLDYLMQAVFALVLLGAAFGGAFYAGRRGRSGSESGTPESGTEKEPEPAPPAQSLKDEPPDEETRRRRERAKAEEEAFRQVMNYNENAAYGIEPEFPAVRR